MFNVYKDAIEDQAFALMLHQICEPQIFYDDEGGGEIMPVDDGKCITELAREVLNGAQLDDLQSLFADDMNVSNSPMGCPTEISPVLMPVSPKTWLDWAMEHQVAKTAAGRRSSGKWSSTVQSEQFVDLRSS